MTFSLLPSQPLQPSDAELARAAQLGDKRAFVEIVARYQTMVGGVTLGILSDFAAGEDAAQETFLTAWRKIQDLREPEHLRAWLAQIARNTALGHLRQRRHTADLENVEELEDDALRPDEAAASEEESGLVRAALEKLPESYRLPLVLFYREGESVRSVAATLGLSEDAVKQRLTRGREMLRERMQGVVESVLKRTRPTALFTITIAAAIGALMAPAAVAGAVFASAAALPVAGTAAGSALSTSTPLITAMTTTHISLTTAALIVAACLPLGYTARLQLENPAPPQVSSAEAAPPPKTAPRDPRVVFPDSPLLAEWKRLHEAHGSSPEALPAIFEDIANLKDPFRRRAFRCALVAEWGQLDPAGGFAFFRDHARDHLGQYLDELTEHDPNLVIDSLLSGDKRLREALRERLSGLARRCPERVMEMVMAVPKADNIFDRAVSTAFSIMAENNFTSAKEAAEAMTGPNREQSLAGVAACWAKTDGPAAIAWAQTLPEGEERNAALRAALVSLSTISPAAALDQIDLVPPGGREGYFASTTAANLLREAVKSNYDATVAWLVANPGRLGREDLMGMASAVTDRLNANPVAFLQHHADNGSLTTLLPAISSAVLNDAGGQREAMWGWVLQQPDSPALQALSSHLLTSTGYRDPTVLLRMVAALPAGSGHDELLQEAARSVFNGGSLLDRFEEVVRNTSGKFQTQIISAAFECLQQNNLDDPQLWSSRLALLPASGQTNAVSSLSQAWATTDPKGAAAWAESLPDETLRTQAVGNVINQYARADAYAASAWLATLPTGPSRDRGSITLARAIAKDQPQEAWQWSLSITDPSTRLSALAETLQTLSAQPDFDAATRRQWVNSTPLTPQEKQHLLEH